MLTQEQIKEIKKKLIQQINSTFPEEKKEEAITKLKEMNNEKLEEFVIQNGLIKNRDTSRQKCIFCSIISRDTPSYKIDENEEAVAILEINPISKGHTLIVPKKHLSSRKEFSEEIFVLAKKVKEKIQEKLKPKEVEISTQNILGHEIINILPIYKEEDINSPRKSAEQEELKKLQKKLTEKKGKSSIKQINAKDIWINQRIP